MESLLYSPHRLNQLATATEAGADTGAEAEAEAEAEAGISPTRWEE